MSQMRLQRYFQALFLTTVNLNIIFVLSIKMAQAPKNTLLKEEVPASSLTFGHLRFMAND